MENLEDLKNITYLSMKNLIYKMYKNTYTEKLNAKEISVGNERNIELTSDGININKKKLGEKIDKKTIKEIFNPETKEFNFTINKDGYYYIKCYDENNNQTGTYFEYIQKGEEEKFLYNLLMYEYFEIYSTTEDSSINLTTDESKLNKLDVQELSIKGNPVNISNSVNIEFVERELPINNMDDKTIYVQKKINFNTIEDFLKSKYFTTGNSVADGYSASIDNQSINNILKGTNSEVIYDSVNGKQYYIKGDYAYNINNSSEIMSVTKNNGNIIVTLDANEYKESKPFTDVVGNTVNLEEGVTITRTQTISSIKVTEKIESEILKNEVKHNGGKVTIENEELDDFGSKIEYSFDVNYSPEQDSAYTNSFKIGDTTYWYGIDASSVNGCTISTDTIINVYIYDYQATKSYNCIIKYLFSIDNGNILKDNEYLVNGNNDYPNDTNIVLGKDSVYIGNIKLV